MKTMIYLASILAGIVLTSASYAGITVTHLPKNVQSAKITWFPGSATKTSLLSEVIDKHEKGSIIKWKDGYSLNNMEQIQINLFKGKGATGEKVCTIKYTGHEDATISFETECPR